MTLEPFIEFLVLKNKQDLPAEWKLLQNKQRSN